ncbi:MAG: amidohydrolase [Bacteroidota bacterium]
MTKLKVFRQELHQFPELSNLEKMTSEKIKDYIQKFKPDLVIDEIGGNGIAFVFNGKTEGKTIMFRCELDALPITEKNDLPYSSVFNGTAHLCGHDGHMAIMAGLAEKLSQEPPKKGKVVLLFQPAEETGEGAERVINDIKFKAIAPDYIFGLHNLPGFEKNSIIISKKHFASASKGMIIQLYGKTSHAAEPENGNSPAMAVSALLKGLTFLPANIHNLKNFALITVIHARLGEKAFGTSPGYAEVMATLRAFEDQDMKNLCLRAEELVNTEKTKEKLETKISYTEDFPALINNTECAEIINKIARNNKYNVIEIESSFKWSEDFAHFTRQYKGAFFGVGAGIEHPQLHNPDYNFNDDILATGINMLDGLYKQFTS